MDHIFTFKDSHNPFLQFTESAEAVSPLKPERKRARTHRRAISLPTNKTSSGHNLGDLLVPEISKTKKVGKRKLSASRKMSELFSFDVSYPHGESNLEGDMKMLNIPNIPKLTRKQKIGKKGGKGGNHRRSSSDPNLTRKRSGSATGKLRGNYNCGKCGVPKKGHICPHDQPKEMADAESQCNFDGVALTGESTSYSQTNCGTMKYKYTTPKAKRAEDVMKILKNMSAMGIIQITDSAKAMDVLLNGNEIVESIPTVTKATTELVAPSTIAPETTITVPSFPQKKTLRTFDAGESNVAGDPYDIDMELSDAFEVTHDLHDLLSDPIDTHDLKQWQSVDFQDNTGTSAVSSA